MIRLRAAVPFAGEALLAFLAVRAIPGIEHVSGGSYQRTLRVGPALGWIEVDVTNAGLALRPSRSLAAVAEEVAARVRGLFDVDADIATIEARLRREGLAAHVRRQPGLRLPGAVDGFETAARAVLGQQISVAGARTLAGRLAERFGEVVPGAPPPLARAFPTAARIAAAADEDLQRIGMPLARARCLRTFAAAIAGGDVDLRRGADPHAAVERMRRLPGIGPWTAHYVAMRALGWADAFLAEDLGVRRALGGAGPREAERIARRWRPYRAYAVIHLWTQPLAQALSSSSARPATTAAGTTRSTRPSARSSSSRAGRRKTR